MCVCVIYICVHYMREIVSVYREREMCVCQTMRHIHKQIPTYLGVDLVRVDVDLARLLADALEGGLHAELRDVGACDAVVWMRIHK